MLWVRKLEKANVQREILTFFTCDLRGLQLQPPSLSSRRDQNQVPGISGSGSSDPRNPSGTVGQRAGSLRHRFRFSHFLDERGEYIKQVRD